MCLAIWAGARLAAAMKRGKGRLGRGWVRCVVAAMVLLAAAMGLARPGLAIDIVDIAKPAAQQDLARYLAGLQTDKRTIQIERPDARTALRTQMALTAAGPGPLFNWVAAGFANSGAERRSVVLAIPQQGITASGFYPARLAGLRVMGAALEGDGSLEPLQVPGENAFLLTMPPGGTATVAFEVTPGPLPVTLWQRDAYDTHKDYLSFFRGALLGVSVLIALALFLLHGFRARILFPVAGGFAVASIGFLLLEAGHLTSIVSSLSLPVLNMQVLRALIEGLMAAFLILLLAQLSDLHRLSRLAGTLLMLAGGLALAIPIYGFAEPLMATAIARAVFVAAAILGFLLIVALWWRSEVKAETAVISSGAILLWTLLAMLAAFSTNPGSSISAVVMAGLGAVLVILGFVLAHHAFTQGYLSRHFFREAGRQTLALAGARAYVWDWQPDEGELFVSPEIGRALGQQMTVQEGVTGEAFLEIMHPADRSAYLATVEQAATDGRRPIERKFRLRHGDGGYRWFELRARSIAGRGSRAARCIGTLTDVTGAKIAEERLLQDAVYDMVTGLPNRALFVDRLDRAIEAAGPAEASGLFVLLIDLDRFKMVNDAMGHEAGDTLLSVIGRRLKAETGQADTVARFPGDQFAILFQEGADGRDVENFAQTLIKAVARPIKFEEHEFILTASIGIAQVREPSQDAERLLKEAAVALYEARRRGAEAVELFNPEMVDDRAELVILEAELRRAIERNEIEVHFQPIARLADMQLAGFEALVRWRHPGLGLLAPESFLGLAEETGMIRDIGRVVLNEAGRQLGIWQRAYRAAEPLFVAVNISSSQLIEPSLIDDVKQIIGRENLARGSFKIEVTESLVMQYPERAQQILERFRELGVGLSCDDFGTGYSSLSSLRKLPFDTLKVDRNFIGPEAEDERASVILQAIIGMGHALGLTIVAEGIERQEQVDRLGELGCDYGQGFFIGKPLTAKQVSDALAGLPYARSSGRTAITWLWERGLKDPPPLPKLIRVTAEDLPKPPPPPVVPAPEASETSETAAETAADTTEAQTAGEEQMPPPAPRQRKRQRRVSLLEDLPEEASGAA
jgi:diguanylate cyclase (GGDEF)-like protein/PAS domain S-box-containing protein